MRRRGGGLLSFMANRPTTRRGRAARSTASAHQRVREAHSAETAEDYVEAIADLIDERGEARVSDLTQRFGVSHVTVSRTVGRLKKAGFVTTSPYKPIELTRAGRTLAQRAKHRHAIVLRFLLDLGVDPATAEQDAEGIEHHVSPRTLAAFEAFSRGA